MSQLRDLRRSRALTYLDLALLSAIPARRLAEAEHGLAHLAPAEYARLAQILGQTEPLVAPPAHPSRPQTARSQHVEWLIAAVLVGAVVGGAAREALTPTSVPPAPISAAVSVNIGQRGPAALAINMVEPEDGSKRAAAAPLRLPAPPAPLSPRLLLAPVPPTLPPAFVMSERGPLGCPVLPTNGKVVMTQGYGVGSHAPATLMGAVDLAIDADGDGYAEPGPSWYAPIVATHSGIIKVTPNSWPAGNHVWVKSAESEWRTGYSHLALITVIDGQRVTAGTVIGLLGSSGVSSGPHLDYQVWHGETNIDPTELVGCR